MGSVGLYDGAEMGLWASWAEATAEKAKTPEGRGKKNPGHWLTERDEGKALDGTGE